MEIIIYYVSNELARGIDLYSNIYVNNVYRWYNIDGESFRILGLPHVIFQNDDIAWYKGDKLHRDEDLPAFISADGFLSWYKNGKLHRGNDLPAVIFPPFLSELVGKWCTTSKWR